MVTRCVVDLLLYLDSFIINQDKDKTPSEKIVLKKTKVCYYSVVLVMVIVL